MPTNFNPIFSNVNLAADPFLSVEKELTNELTNRVRAQQGELKVISSTDTTLAFHSSRSLHFKAVYSNRTIHTIIQFLIHDKWIYIVDFGCLEEDFEADWNATQILLEHFRLFRADLPPW